MIQPTELRIGNYYIDICGTPNQWQLSSYEFYNKHPLDGDNKYSDIKPIPLTPEILEKCGFVKEIITNEEVFKNYNKSLFDFFFFKTLEKKNGYFLYHKFYNAPSMRKSIGFVHQLQNLYFALTGEELNVQL